VAVSSKFCITEIHFIRRNDQQRLITPQSVLCTPVVIDLLAHPLKAGPRCEGGSPVEPLVRVAQECLDVSRVDEYRI
jgi:hypothetical protein